jgi:hypothetical protein
MPDVTATCRVLNFFFPTVMLGRVDKPGRAVKYGMGFDTLNLKFNGTCVLQRPQASAYPGAKLFKASLFGQAPPYLI